MKSTSAIATALCILTAISTSFAGVIDNSESTILARSDEEPEWSGEPVKTCAAWGGVISCCDHKRGGWALQENHLDDCVRVDNQVLYGNMDERTLAKEAKEGHFPGKTCPDHGFDHGPYCCHVESNREPSGLDHDIWRCFRANELEKFLKNT